TQHDGLWIEPTALVQQTTQTQTVDAVLFNGVFVVNTRYQTLVSNVQQSHAGGFVNATALGFDDAVFDLVAHAQTMTAADAVRFQHQFHRVGEFHTVQSNRLTFLKAHTHLFSRHGHIVTPERDTHNGFDDIDAGIQVLQILGLMRGTQHVGIGGVGFLGRHLVVETVFLHVLGHLGTATQLINKGLVQPRFVNLQFGVGQQTVAVETLNVVALVGAAIAPDMNIVLFHGGHQHGTGYSAANRRGVEVGDTARGDMKSVALQSGNPFGHQLLTAIHQACQGGAVFLGLARD